MKEDKKKLWIQAIKWPLYSVAVMPIFISAVFNLYLHNKIIIPNFIGFTIASVLILLWENLTNDLFDSETGIDEFKFHSVVNLINNKKIISFIAYFSLIIGLFIIFIISLSVNIKIIFLIITCCFLGYLYQGPPFRLGYLGLGEPLCWIAFGPLAYSAALLALNPFSNNLSSIPWRDSFLLGTGPALAITLVLFCSHFHQIKDDKKHGKISPLVLIGSKRASQCIPWIILTIYLFQFYIIYIGFLPHLCLLYLLSFHYGLKLVKLLKNFYNSPLLIKNCKFIAIKFQTFNGLGLILGLFLSWLS
ncbi:MAG: 2-carboxy-1,4-naphthoquinone phytyltransferase [Prochlorococcus sp. SP3034]|nr:2-carboxy-1,4-naphthoquinone phytyltransferase [Prochlorococcus sp. SP3034]|tara:strand:- start:18195 stop:19106 length:912 start_codon:yes stop_codon:yes gene_type:complete